ncbi:MAG: hypothetical protein U5L01_14585 [Rheinheimera sp.]|nr:hypothetical protein [Rheinheimera sp.]
MKMLLRLDAGLTNSVLYVANKPLPFAMHDTSAIEMLGLAVFH